jgi:hypothetical protein
MAGRGPSMIALLLGCTAIAATGRAAAGSERPLAEMKRLLVIAGGNAAHAHLGSYCLRAGGTTPGDTGTRECSSVAYDPHPRPVFRVTVHSTVVTCAGHPAARVRVSLLRDGEHGPKQLATRRARRLDRAGQCWRSTLPRRLRKATSLDVRVGYGRAGYAYFVVGIHTGR